MTQDVAGGPPRLPHQEILEEEHARDGHTHNVLSVCRCIATLARDAVEKGDFEEDNSGMTIIQAILAEAQNVLKYMRQRRNKWIGYTQ